MTKGTRKKENDMETNTIEYRTLWWTQGWYTVLVLVGIGVYGLTVWNYVVEYHGWIDANYIRTGFPGLKWGTLILLAGLVPLAHAKFRRYRLTEHGVESVTGILVRTTESIPYRKIRMVTVHQGIEGRLWDYGRVYVEYSGGSDGAKHAIKMKGVRHPKAIKQEIENRIRG